MPQNFGQKIGAGHGDTREINDDDNRCLQAEIFLLSSQHMIRMGGKNETRKKMKKMIFWQTDGVTRDYAEDLTDWPRVWRCYFGCKEVKEEVV